MTGIPNKSPQISPDSFFGETVFVTGCSGFLGKVILEKLMRSFNCKRIYVLIRTKKNKDTRIRFRAEILGSQIFQTLRQEKGDDFDKWASGLVVPVAGDLLQPEIGFSPADRARLCAEVDVIMHSAASVDFDLPLEEATQINVDGSLSVLALAQDCAHLRSLVHVSTCYVNSNLRGTVEEKIYPSPFDVEQTYSRIKNSSPEQLARDRAEIVGPWPNSYTLTKFIAEHLLVTRNALGRTVPLSICRPSIISAALAEPVPGWTDCISAASAVFLAIGMGICPIMPGSIWSVGDVVPVDICAHMIIAAGAVGEGPKIVHCGTSSWAEPMTWFSAIDAVCQYFSAHPMAKRIRAPSVKMVPNPTSFDIQRYLNTHLPQRVAQFMESVSGSKTLSQLARAIRSGDRVVEAFSYFTQNEWVFDSACTFLVEPPELLLLRVKQIDWFQYMYMVCYGMRKFCLGEAHAEVPLNKSFVGDALARAKVDLIQSQHPNPLSAWFAHIFWAANGVQMNYVAATHAALEEGVMRNPHVVATIAQCAAKQSLSRELLHSFGTQFDYTNTRFFGWTLQKVFATMYDRVSVNEDVLTEIGRLTSANECPVLLIPTHRSYMDFLILSFILFAYHQKVPFIAAGEDFQKIPGINAFLRKSGAFFMKRKLDPKTDPLYVALFKAYFQEIIMKHGLVEFFIEGGRSRTGAQLHPKFGLLSFAVELLYEAKIPNLKIVPVSISYGRVLEAESFPRELLGKPKARESLSRLVGAVSSLRSHHGRAHVVFGEPIDVKKFVKGKNMKETVQQLGLHIGRCLEANVVIMATHLVAAAMLTERAGQPLSVLVAKVEGLRNDCRDRGRGMEVPTMGTCADTVESCVRTHFANILHVDKELFVTIKSDDVLHNTLMLAYYRNQLLAVFADEAMVLIALRASTNQTELFTNVLFVAQLCGKSGTTGCVEHVTQTLVERGVVFEEKRGDNIHYRVNPQFQTHVEFLTGLLSCQIDTAWATAIALSRMDDKRVAAVTKQAQELILSLGDLCAECASLEAIKIALHAFSKMRVINKKEQVELLGRPEALDAIVIRIAQLRYATEAITVSHAPEDLIVARL